jgi:hypothetical protein
MRLQNQRACIKPQLGHLLKNFKQVAEFLSVSLFPAVHGHSEQSSFYEAGLPSSWAITMRPQLSFPATPQQGKAPVKQDFSGEAGPRQRKVDYCPWEVQLQMEAAAADSGTESHT